MTPIEHDCCGSWPLAPVAFALLAASHLPADEPKDKAAEEAALLKTAEAFVEAFHKGDAKAVAAFWTKDGDYTDQEGHTVKGQEAIEKSFTAFFAENKGLKLHRHHRRQICHGGGRH